MPETHDLIVIACLELAVVPRTHQAVEPVVILINTRLPIVERRQSNLFYRRNRTGPQIVDSVRERPIRVIGAQEERRGAAMPFRQLADLARDRQQPVEAELLRPVILAEPHVLKGHVLAVPDVRELLEDGTDGNVAEVKSLRAAMGSTYHVPLWIGDLPAEFAKLKGSGFVLLAGHLKGTEGIPEVGKKCVLVIGNEGAGVSAEVSALCTKVRLPMKGRAESLNASAAAAIFLYELSKKM